MPARNTYIKTATGWEQVASGSEITAINDLSDVVITSASTGQGIVYNGSNWVNTTSSPNFVLNGAFDIWQRGTSFSATGYCADRWYFAETGTCVVTQETVEVPTGYVYSLKANATTSSDSADIYQSLEQMDVEQLRGKTVTFSVNLKMDANMISQTGNFELKTYYSNLTDARASQTTVVNNTNGQTSTVITKSNHSGWAVASHTFVVPTDAVGLRLAIEPPLTGASPSQAVYWVTGAQLEIGSFATPFKRSSPTYAQELAACQRYYIQFTAGSVGGNFAFFATTTAYSSTAAGWAAMLPDTMRTIPSISTSGNFRLVGSTTVSVTSIALYGVGSMPQPVSLTVSVASGLTSGSGYILSANNDATATVKFDSEL